MAAVEKQQCVCEAYESPLKGSLQPPARASSCTSLSNMFHRYLSSSLQACTRRSRRWIPNGNYLDGRQNMLRTNQRYESSSSTTTEATSSKKNSATSSSKETIKKQDDLKWTERDEAPKWMQKMAPSKGGTKLPTPVEGTVIAIVAAGAYYAWFVDPPSQSPPEQDDKEEEKENEDVSTAK